MLVRSFALQLTVFGCAVAASSSSLTFLYFELLPILHTMFPAIGQLHTEHPYLFHGLLSLTSLFIAVCGLAKFSVFRRAREFMNYNGLHELLEAGTFGTDYGILCLDADRRVLGGNSLIAKFAKAATINRLLNKRFESCVSENFARILIEVQDKARTTRQPAVLEVADWTHYSHVELGPVLIIANPAFKGARFLGYIIIFRSSTELRLAEDSAIMHQQKYQALCDTLQVGVAVLRPAVSSDGGADAYLVEANPAFRKLLEGLPMPYHVPCSAAWPHFSAQDSLREAIGLIVSGSPFSRCELFAPTIGKHFEFALSALPGGRILALMSDQTDMRVHEESVLTLNDRLERSLARQSDNLGQILQDIGSFNQATTDVVESYLDRVRDIGHQMQGPFAAELTETAAQLNRTLQQMLRYHEVPNLPYNESKLVYPNDLIARLATSLTKRYPHVSFNLTSLPAVVASVEVLTNIVEQLLVSVASLPVEGAARVEVGGHSDFLNTGLYVAAWGFASDALFVEIPGDDQVLDWTMTSDLDLAVVRRMVANHGGNIFIGPTDDGAGIKMSVTIGTPT